MVAVLPPGHGKLVVGSESASLIGVSGRPVATIQRGEAVVTYGERGPYTIVNWEGRNGFVLSSDLVTAAEFDAAPEDAAADAAEQATAIGPRRSWFQLPWRRSAV